MNNKTFNYLNKKVGKIFTIQDIFNILEIESKKLNRIKYFDNNKKQISEKAFNQMVKIAEK